MKGINLLGNFEDNELQTIDIVKNAEMVYYLYDDTTQNLIGIDKAICSAMQLRMADNQIQSITFLTKPEGAVYPIEELPKDQQQLPGFYWRGDEMIRSKADLIMNTVKNEPVSKKTDAEEVTSRIKLQIK
jgi:hypothetical protein